MFKTPDGESLERSEEFGDPVEEPKAEAKKRSEEVAKRAEELLETYVSELHRDSSCEAN